MSIRRWLSRLQPDADTEAIQSQREIEDARRNLEEARRILREAREMDAEVDTIVHETKDALRRNQIGRKLRVAVRVAHR